MTNAEKYLKDGVDIGQLAREITELSWSNDDCLEDNITLYFRRQVKLTLTEDERVILRNIPIEYTIIRRNEWCDLEFVREDRAYRSCYLLSHLFHFIKNGEEYSIEDLLKGDK